MSSCFYSCVGFNKINEFLILGFKLALGRPVGPRVKHSVKIGVG